MAGRGGSAVWISRTGEQLAIRSITRFVTKVMAAADVEQTAHDLRDTLATRLVRDHGQDLALVAGGLGHADVKTTRRYAPSEIEDRRAALKFVEVATVHVARARAAVRRPRACPFCCPPGLAAAARAWEARVLRSMSTTTDVIRGLPDDPDLSVEITMGTEHFRNGAIALAVRGDGAVSVQQRRAGDEREYRGRLDAERMRRLADELAADELGELADSGGDREPDDLPITIRIERAGELVHAASIRESDRWKDERLNRLVRRYDALVAELTDGALPYGRPA